MTTKPKESDLSKQLRVIGGFNSGWMWYPFVFRKEVESGTCLGAVDFDKAEILIEEGLESRVLQHTMIHECWHVLVSSGGLRQSDEDVDKEITTTNEFVTELISRSIKMFKLLNPELWKVLYDE